VSALHRLLYIGCATFAAWNSGPVRLGRRTAGGGCPYMGFVVLAVVIGAGDFGG